MTTPQSFHSPICHLVGLVVGSFVERVLAHVVKRNASLVGNKKVFRSLIDLQRPEGVSRFRRRAGDAERQGRRHLQPLARRGPPLGDGHGVPLRRVPHPQSQRAGQLRHRQAHRQRPKASRARKALHARQTPLGPLG
jgi:hypothetical protein